MNHDNTDSPMSRTEGIISWFVHNHVAANLLMVMIIVLGAASLFTMKQEVFPEVDLDIIQVTVLYPGASPEEVEEAICTRIEEKVASVDGVKEIRSRASEGVGSVTIELEKGADTRKALDDVQTEVDRITTFPDEAEEPIITEITNRRQVINLVIYGDTDEKTLKEYAEKAKNDLTGSWVPKKEELFIDPDSSKFKKTILTIYSKLKSAIKNLFTREQSISQADLSGVRDYEISVEVSETTLRRYGITFDQVVAALRGSSLDLPGGSVKTEAGEILIRTKGQRYTGLEFERIVILSRADGTNIELGQLARVIDGFDEDTPLTTRYDGSPAAMVQVFRVAEQDAIDVADTVKRYMAEKEPLLPPGLKMGVWSDRTEILKSRRDLLLKNGKVGLVLVFICLTLFLNLRLAFWVMMGIPISFMGALWLIPQAGTSINMISLFAFIVSLGIVVDDAIVVGENIFTHWEEGKSPVRAAIDGAMEMMKPVTFAVLTSVAAFVPLLYVDGSMGKFMKHIPVVVIAVLIFSLIESLLILPVHLSTMKGRHHKHGDKKPWPLERLRRLFGRGLEYFVRVPYAATLDLAVKWRYLTTAIFIAALLISFGMVKGGAVKFLFFPKVESDFVRARLSMPQGSSIDLTQAVTKRLEETALEIQRELNGDDDDPVVRHIFTVIGGQTARSGPISGSASASHLAEVSLQLTPSEGRTITSSEISRMWRKAVGTIGNADSLTFSSSLFGSGSPIQVRLTGDRFDTLAQAAERLKEKLAEYPGVTDIEDSFREGKMELKLKLKPAARSLGITLADLARQMRQGYHGEEALSIQRGRDDVKVMVRYPADERRSLGDIEKMRIRTSTGAEIPFSQVAEVELGRGFASINRQERQRVITVTADVEEKTANAADILDELKADFLPQLAARHQGVTYGFEGHDKSRAESLASLGKGYILAMLAIYVLLAIPFGTYTQPLVVMSAIPFGIIGAVWGHIIMGMPLTILSMFGIVALSGVVVNDSLIMVDYINRAREKGMELHKAVMLSGKKRFRPILLTTLTTFFGLLPLLLEKSVQAQFLIPMALSLAVGIVVATAITLILIPTLYTILEDIMFLIGYESKRWTNGNGEDEEVVAEDDKKEAVEVV